MTSTTERNSRTTSRRKPPAATFQPPEPPKIRRARKVTPAEPAPVVTPTEDHPRPSHHNGVAVISEQRIAAPTGHGYFRISRIALANGETAYACWDCTYTGDGRGDVMAHRNAEHGSRYGKKQPKDKDPDLFDLILPDRPDGTRPGERSIDWTIGEIVAVFPSLTAFGNRLEALEQENEQLTEQLKQNRVSKADQHKISVYESHQIEIGELRAKVARQGNYEQVKEEVYALRAWKKKVIARLAAVGFQLSEEDQ